MKKHLTSIAVILCILIISSCQKEAGADLPAPTNKVKTYTEEVTSSIMGNSVATFNLSYDGSNRITSFVSATDPGTKIIYTYPSENSLTSELYNSGELQIHEVCYLVNNRVDSTYQYNNTGDTTTQKYVYNSAGSWAKLYEYDYSKNSGSDLFNTVTYTYDGKGNQVKEEGTDTNVTTWEYYDGETYFLPLLGPALTPAVKFNLAKTATITSNGYPVGTLTFTYTFDNNNRVSSQKGVADDGSIIIKTYTYY